MSIPPGFGQFIIGPPGSGKTTYCYAVKQFLEGIGRKVAIFNLDPANDNMPFAPDWDLSEIICLKDVMDLLKLGPNGALLYCLEFLEKNFQHMESKLKGIMLIMAYSGLTNGWMNVEDVNKVYPSQE